MLEQGRRHCWAGSSIQGRAGQEGAQGVHTTPAQVRQQCLKAAARIKYKEGSAVNMECFKSDG